MSTKLKASLEEAIQTWANKHAESGDAWPSEGYFGETLAARMAEAAYAVFMVSFEAQEFAKAQGPE